MTRGRTWLLGLLTLLAGWIAEAQVTYTVTTDADAFLATGAPGNPAGADLTGQNYGGAGTLVVAPAASVKGEFQSVIRFDLSGATNLFDTMYGSNNWAISSISLDLTSNYGTAGAQPNNSIFPVISAGNFVIEWLADDDWTEGIGTPSLYSTNGVTWDSLPDLLAGAHDILCTNTYTPPGDNVHVTYPLPLDTNLVSDAAAGGEVTFLFYAADDQVGYLFNSYFYGRGNQPLIHVTANALPPRILSGYFTTNSFHLTGAGIANGQYEVQDATNLPASNWQTVGTVTADNAGMIQFDDTTATKESQRFYRLEH